MIKVDPSFRDARKKARARRHKRWIIRMTVFGLLPLTLIAVPVLLFTDLGETVFRNDDDMLELVQVETDLDIAPPVQNNAFIDIAGDPTILRLPDIDDTAAERRKQIEGPGILDISRFGLPQSDRLTIIRDSLVVRETRLITALPSSREDFAFFETQQSRASMQPAGALNSEAAERLKQLDLSVELGDLTDSYGAPLETGADAEEDTVRKTAVENTTSIAYVRAEPMRVPLFEDIIVQVELDRTLAGLFAENGLQDTDSNAVIRLLPDAAELKRGAIIALRLRPSPNGARLLQMSYYAPDGYVGSVAKLENGTFVPASDPWWSDDLMTLAKQGDEGNQSETSDGRYRLLDAVYSAAIRNGVPTPLVGEIVAMMSKAHDLDKLAVEGDSVTIAFAPQHGPNGELAGQVMFAGIRGPSGDMPCYVVPDQEDGGYSCFAPGHVTPSTGPGFVTPVQGILTSKFGPRKHPIHKVVRLHAGVDWAAPTGTSVRAAAAGTISLAGDGKGYGNLVIIKHPGGLETRYAHLNRFADIAKKGALVGKGEVIGYVGTTGRSTGPHLHFETRRDGDPVDPIPLLSGGQVAVASGAVDALVQQIIRVESAGNPNAKNPLSSATGLGQFINSTWLRMMRTYRPELVATMSRKDLLALRRDPTISRDMVTKLAQENEAYLRSRGHQSTPGRLYLAHFLGPGGADTVLRANESRTVLDVMGQAVVSANPFLRKYTVADLKAWADRKMRPRGSTPIIVAAAPASVTPEVRLYMEMVDDILESNS